MADKRQKILESAIRVFADKGFEKSTLSQVAKDANIATSGIYACFDSKEDILFSVINDFLVSCAQGLGEHLEGIQGPVNKLRKAVWFHCKSYSSSRKEIQIILESRSYPRFYASEAYNHLKLYSRIFSSIVEEGISSGEFCNISSPGILRDMILGTIDHVAINWTLKNGPSPLEISEHLFDLINNAATRKESKATQTANKAQKQRLILDIASRMFAESGYKDTGVADIASEAGVSEGIIYEYYQNKENLLINIPETKLCRLLEQIAGNRPEDKLRKAIHTLFNFHDEDREYSTILVLFLRPNKNFYHSKSNKILDEVFKIIEETIEAGQDDGSFKMNLDPSVYRALIFGSIDHVIIPWVIFNRNYDLIKVGKEISRIFVDAIRKD